MHAPEVEFRDRAGGRILRVPHTIKDVNYKGYIHRASRDDPQYAIKSDKTVIWSTVIVGAGCRTVMSG